MLHSLEALAGATAYVVVGILAALEASAFVGLFVPGELALLAGGYIAQQGNASLLLMMIVGTAGAIVGDSIGYEIGRHFGPALQGSRLGRRVGAERWRRAEQYLLDKGGRAVFAGRFVGVLRALVPALAGAGRMPYRRFLVWNAAGAAVWAPGVVLAGYLAGSSYRRVERYIGAAGLVLLALAVVIGSIVAAARWIAAHPDRVRAWADRQRRRRVVALVADRYGSQIRFLAQRVRPGNALGLLLTAQLVVLVASGWAFGALAQDVLGQDDSTRIDRPAVRYLAEHRAPWLTTAMRDLTWLGSTLVLTLVVVAAGVLVHRRTRRWSAAAPLAVSFVGAIALQKALKALVERPRPHIGPVVASASGYSFPSGHATEVTAVAVTVAVIGASAARTWTAKVAIWAAALLCCLAVGFTRVYLGVHWPTDVLGGFALGGLWASIVTIALHTLPAARTGDVQRST